MNDLLKALSNLSADERAELQALLGAVENSGTSAIDDLLSVDASADYNVKSADEMKPVVAVWAWSMANARRKLHRNIDEHGTDHLTDSAMSLELNKWLKKYRIGNADLSLNNGVNLMILDESDEDKFKETVAEFLAESVFDKLVAGIAAYHDYWQRLTVDSNATLPAGIMTLDEMEDKLKEALHEIGLFLQGGSVAADAKMMADELAYIVKPAFQSAEIVAGFIGPIPAGKTPLNAFIDNKKSPQKTLRTGINLAKAFNGILDELSSYSADVPFVDFIKKAGKSAKAYAIAIGDFAASSPTYTGGSRMTSFAAVYTTVKTMIYPDGSVSVETVVSASAGTVETHGVYMGHDRPDPVDYSWVKDFNAPALRPVMVNLLSSSDLSDVYLEIGISTDDYAGGKGELVRNVIGYCQRRSLHGKLLTAISKIRPDIDLSEAIVFEDAKSGGAYVAGNVNTGGGDFVGRNVYNIGNVGDYIADDKAGGNIYHVDGDMTINH